MQVGQIERSWFDNDLWSLIPHAYVDYPKRKQSEKEQTKRDLWTMSTNEVTMSANQVTQERTLKVLN